MTMCGGLRSEIKGFGSAEMTRSFIAQKLTFHHESCTISKHSSGGKHNEKVVDTGNSNKSDFSTSLFGIVPRTKTRDGC